MWPRGLIALILIWGTLWIVPAFRPQTQRMRASLTDSDRWPYPPLFDKVQLQRALDKHPDSGLLEVEKLGAAPGNAGPDYWREFDAIVARHPSDLAVRRAKMLQATSGGLVKMIWTPAVGPPGGYSGRDLERSRQQARNWQNQRQRAMLVEQARAGEAQAPGDGFFPWMEAMALWGRDDEPALQALERAGRAKTFDDGSIEQRRALLKLREELGPLQWDEKLATLWAALFPHLAQMRTLQYEVIWSGVAHYRRGDKAGAYRRWRVALEAASVMRRAQSQGPQATLIGMLVGEAMQRQVWEIVAKELNPIGGKTDPNGWPDERLLAAFQVLARRDGQGALADFAGAERADFQGRALGAGIGTKTYQNALGLSVPAVRLSLQLPWLERNVFWLGVAGALCLAVAWAWRRQTGAFFEQASAHQIAFFGALWTGALGLAALWSVGPELRILDGLSGESIRGVSAWVAFFDNPLLYWTAVAATFAGAIALRYRRHARGQRRLRAQLLKRVPGARPERGLWLFLVGALWTIVAMVALAALATAQNNWPELRWSWVALSLVALASSVMVLQKRAAASEWKRGYAALASAALALTAFGLGVEFGVRDNLPTLLAVAVLVLGAVAILSYLGASATAWRALATSALQTALQTLGGVALVCSLALLLISLAMLPVRARQNRVMDDYIARGEVSWMRAQMQTQNSVAAP